jgi:hypothetical protein
MVGEQCERSYQGGGEKPEYPLEAIDSIDTRAGNVAQLFWKFPFSRVFKMSKITKMVLIHKMLPVPFGLPLGT